MREGEAQSTPQARVPSLLVQHSKFMVMGSAAAALWSLAGCAIAYRQNDLWDFVAEWRRLQALPCLAFAVWLFLLSRSDIFRRRIRRAIEKGSRTPRGLRDRRLRFLIVIAVWVLATATSIGMGFYARGLLIIFFWATAALSGLLAGLVMVHTIDVITVIHQLQTTKVKTFQYSPARTPELRDVVSYFATFALILGAAYFFAFVGTISGRWTGNHLFIQAVQWFWPIVYVPICSIALLYPHFAIHSLIRHVKEGVLITYQQQIDSLIAEYQDLDKDGIDRVNALTQFFDRMANTPDYVIDFGLAVRTCIPLLFNLAIVIIKYSFGQT